MATRLIVRQGLVYPEPRGRRRRPQAEIGDEPESSFMARGIQYLRLRGWDMIYHCWDSTNSEAGFPDVIALRDGRGLALEFKSQHGDVRPKQKQWIAEFEKVPGFIGAVVRPSDWPWIVRIAK